MNGLVDTFTNRLNTAIRIRNIKPVELSEKTGIDKSKISSYMSGRYKAKQDGVYLLAKALDVNEAWLMGCDVPMERNYVYADEWTSNEKKSKILTPLSDLQQTEIPVLGTVKAGYDYLANENVIGKVYLDFKPSDPENYYALQVTGDSMEPLFSDGDIAIVHKQDNFESGNTCIILVNGDEATVKKVVRMEDGIDLIAMNPYYPVRHFSKNEMNEIPVKIIGKVIEARKRKIFE